MRLKLADGEHVIVKTRRHPRTLARPAVAWFAVVPATAYASGWLTREGLPAPVADAAPWLRIAVPALGAALLLAWSVAPSLRWRRTWMFLTNRRVVIRRGWGARSQWELPLVIVRELHVRQPAFRRGSGSGTLVLATANGDARLEAVPAVHRLRELVLDAIEALPRTVMFDGVEIDREQRMDWTDHG